MKQEFVTLPREVVEQAIEALFCTDSEEWSTAYENELKAVKKLSAALKQPQDHIEQHLGMVPAGWRLVPVTPTPEMIRVMCAYDGTQYSNTFDSDDFKEDYRNMLAAAPQPQADQPAMTPIAQRKLDSLLAGGYTISGYSVYHERKHQHGFVTGAGLVGWWRPDGMEYPQPRGEQEPMRPSDEGYHGFPHAGQFQWVVDLIIDGIRSDRTTASLEPPTIEQEPVALLADAIRSEPTELIHKWRVLELIQDHARQQPKREPLTNEQVKAGLIHSIEYTDARERCAFNIGVRFAERAHNIK